MNKIILERQNEIISIAFGYIQLHPNDMFLPIAVASTGKSLLFYNDSQADDVSKGDLIYKIRREVHFSNIKEILHTTYSRNVEYKDYGVISITLLNSNDGFSFSYRKEDKKEIKQLLASLVQLRVKVRHKIEARPPLYKAYKTEFKK